MKLHKNKIIAPFLDPRRSKNYKPNIPDFDVGTILLSWAASAMLEDLKSGTWQHL